MLRRSIAKGADFAIECTPALAEHDEAVPAGFKVHSAGNSVAPDTLFTQRNDGFVVG